MADDFVDYGDNAAGWIIGTGVYAPIIHNHTYYIPDINDQTGTGTQKFGYLTYLSKPEIRKWHPLQQRFLWDKTVWTVDIVENWYGEYHKIDSLVQKSMTWTFQVPQEGIPNSGTLNEYFIQGETSAESPSGLKYITWDGERPRTVKRPGMFGLPRESHKDFYLQMMADSNSGIIDPSIKIQRGYLLRFRRKQQAGIDNYIYLWECNHDVVEHNPDNIWILDWSLYRYDEPHRGGYSITKAPYGWTWPRPTDQFLICVKTSANIAPPGTAIWGGIQAGFENQIKPVFLVDDLRKEYVIIHLITTG